ncbi:MAG: M48 family metalloprotease [Planctomycetaceae bacterium]|nr:M48 family metalloprotease [Planctomycetaceae bacterium]
MPVETFRTLIARNKRNSVVLIGVFMLFFIAVGYLIGWAWGGTDAFGITVAFGAGLIAFILTLISFYGGSSALLSMSSAREISKGDDPQLFNVVEELSLAGGVPMPRVYLIDDSAMNAFATGRDPAHAAVAITTGLREKLTREELQGVLAHELSHVRNYDIRYAMLMAVMVGVLVMLCDVFLRSLWYSGRGRRRSNSRDSGGGGAQIILLILALVLAIVAPILAKIIEMALSRQREYLADAGSVELTRNARGLQSALAKLSEDPEVLEVANRATAPLYIVHPIKHFEERSASVFDSHPPIADRIRRLQSLQ